MKYVFIWIFGLLMVVSSCDNNNTSGIDENDVANEAEIVATDTVEYIPERVDSILVLPDTVMVTPDTVGLKEELEEDRN